MDYVSDVNGRQDCGDGAQKSFEEGVQEGIQKGRAAIARNMIRDHLPLMLILKYTGFSEEEIDSLR
jgi:hypothetical protein